MNPRFSCLTAGIEIFNNETLRFAPRKMVISAKLYCGKDLFKVDKKMIEQQQWVFFPGKVQILY